MKINPEILNRIIQARPFSPDEAWRMYAPPRTWGATEEHQLAMDAHLQDCGYAGLIQHAIGMGMGMSEIAPQFLGYPYLAGLAQNALIRAGVTTIADDLTKKWVEFKRGGESADDDEKIQAIRKAFSDFKLQNIFNEAAQKCDFDGGCLVFIDTGEKDADLSRPLALIGGRKIKRFVLVEAINVYPGNYNASDPLDDSYFKPDSWLILGKRVHRSRFLYFAPNQLPVLLRPAYNFFGIPIAQQALDYVAHFTKTREAAQRLLTKFSLTVFKTDMTSILSGGGAEHFDRRLQYLAQNRDSDMILAVDMAREDVVKLETPLSGVIDVPRQALEFVSMIFRTPVTRFLGISPAGMNSTGESDARNYIEHLESKQEKMLRPPLDHALEVIQMHLYGEVDADINVDFCPLSDEDDAQKTTTWKTKVDGLVALVQAGIASEDEARRVLVDDPDSDLGFIDPDEVPPAPEGGDPGAGEEGFDEGPDEARALSLLEKMRGIFKGE